MLGASLFPIRWFPSRAATLVIALNVVSGKEGAGFVMVHLEQELANLGAEVVGELRADLIDQKPNEHLLSCRVTRIPQETNRAGDDAVVPSQMFDTLELERLDLLTELARAHLRHFNKAEWPMDDEVAIAHQTIDHAVRSPDKRDPALLVELEKGRASPCVMQDLSNPFADLYLRDRVDHVRRDPGANTRTLHDRVNEEIQAV